MSYPPLALRCYSGLFFETPGRFHNEQKNSTRAGDTFGEWPYAPCPWFLGMDTGGSTEWHSTNACLAGGSGQDRLFGALFNQLHFEAVETQ